MGSYDRGILLDGQWLPTGEVRTVRNPANGAEVAAVALARPQDVDAAVRVAAAAQPEWAAT
ncbi:MAG: aldehyde dehydrogenase family protein, partial [Micromonosporaceae bacterium]